MVSGTTYREEPPGAGRLALAMSLACVALSVPTLALLVVGPSRVPPSDIFAGVGGGAFVILALTFASVGAVVARRVPANRIGWVFCVTGLVTMVQVFTWQYADVGLNSAHRLPAAAAASVANTMVGEANAALLALALFLVPDGRLPSPRWRPALGGLLVGMALLVLAGTLRPGHYASPFDGQTNPFGVPGARAATDVADAAGWALVVTALALAAWGMVVRLRRAHGVERQQIKLVLAVGSAAATAAALLMSTWLVWPSGALQLRIAAIGLVVATLPAASGVAILRYRLYDIDVIIRKTVVYALVVAVLSLVYIGGIFALGLALGSVTGGTSTIALTVITLGVVAIFQPVRRRIQLGIDRRFYRDRYDSVQIVSRFNERMRDQVDLSALEGELVSVVSTALQPASIDLWIRADDVLRRADGHGTRRPG